MYVCVRVDYLSLTFSLAVHMVLCRKQQRGNANLESCNFFFFACLCVFISVCLFVCNCVRIGIHSY